jgi:hypothetical protein
LLLGDNASTVQKEEYNARIYANDTKFELLTGSVFVPRMAGDRFHADSMLFDHFALTNLKI